MAVNLWNPQKEQMPRDALQAQQLEKLKAQLVRVYEQSPYYKAKFNKAGVDPHQFDSFEQYRDYPFFDKDEERGSQEVSRDRRSSFRHAHHMRPVSRKPGLLFLRHHGFSHLQRLYPPRSRMHQR